MLSGEATNTNLTVLGFTRPGVEPMVYHTRDEHANQYTTQKVHKQFCNDNKLMILPNNETLPQTMTIKKCFYIIKISFNRMLYCKSYIDPTAIDIVIFM